LGKKKSLALLEEISQSMGKKAVWEGSFSETPLEQQAGGEKRRWETDSRKLEKKVETQKESDAEWLEARWKSPKGSCKIRKHLKLKKTPRSQTWGNILRGKIRGSERLEKMQRCLVKRATG